MNILYYGYPLSQLGAPHQSMAAIHLARKYDGLDFICWGKEPDGLSREYNNINYMPQPKGGGLSAVLLLLTLIRLIVFAKKKYDIIYVQGAQQTPFLFWLPLVKSRLRIIYHTQDYLEPRRHRFYEFFEKWFARHADYVICNEPNRARFMQSYYGLQHMPVALRTALPAWWAIPDRCAEMREDILRQAGLADAEGVIIIVAGGPYRADRMSPQLLDAFSRLPDHYVIVFNGPPMEPGKSSRVECGYRMKELKIASRVVFFGGLNFRELLSLYSAGDVGILLYPNDGVGHYYQCPGRFSEYLRCGLSLVSSNFIGLELLTLKYGLGAVCNAEDPASIFTALLEAGKGAKTNRNHIITTAEKEFVYEGEGGAAVLAPIIEGTYVHSAPSVCT